MAELPPDGKEFNDDNTDTDSSKGSSKKYSVEDMRRLSRRNFLKGSLTTIVSLGAAAGAGAIIFHGYESFDNTRARQTTESLFLNSGLQSWSQLSIVPMMLQLDVSIPVSKSMFPDSNNTSNVSSPDSEFLISTNPIAIRQTILDNMSTFSEASKRSVNRALPDISDTIIGFYQPGGDFVFCDVQGNQGLITPITNGETWSGQELGVSNVKVAGRYLEGSIVYPFTNNSGFNGYEWQFEQKPNTNIIGHCVTFGDYDSLFNAEAGWLDYGENPVKPPIT